MYLTGFADEAAAGIEGQITVTGELGWHSIEARAIDGQNLTLVDERTFQDVCDRLGAAGITINCFGSGVANWAKKITEPPDSSYEEMKKAIPRMQRLGTTMIRIMSFEVPAEVVAQDWSKAAIERIKTIVKMAEDGGVVCVHENCSGWAGLSYEHTLRLLDAITSPALKLVFDTGNPVFHDDVRGTPPYGKQDSWQFYQAVKAHIVYVHIKDGRRDDGKDVFTFPGEGNGQVRRIVEDLLRNGYDGGFSIEPHMAVVHHDKSVTSPDEIRYLNYLEYGRRMEKMLGEIKSELGRT